MLYKCPKFMLKGSKLWCHGLRPSFYNIFLTLRVVSKMPKIMLKASILWILTPFNNTFLSLKLALRVMYLKYQECFF